MLTIDGSTGEGGGQILRTALTLSAITQKPFRIKNIRANRKEKGLRPQHLSCINACAKICNAEVSGAEIGSKEITFIPKYISSKEYKFEFDIGTAGSIPLLLQTILPVLAFAPSTSKVELFGGTDIEFSPTMDYILHVFCSFLQKVGITTHSHILKHGFYPKGRGRVKILIYPWIKKYPLHIEKIGKFIRIDVWSIASSDLKSRDVARRQTYGFHEIVNSNGKETEQYVNSLSPGSSFHAHAHFENTKIGVCEVGALKKTAEQVGKIAGEKLLEEIKSKSTLDKNMADQMLLILSLCGGSFKISQQTPHFKTNKKIIEKFIDCRISVQNNLVRIIAGKV